MTTHTTSIATTDPRERARQKSWLVLEALQALADRGVGFDFEEMTAKCVAYIIKTRGWNQHSNIDKSKAQAITIVTLNLVLDLLTESDPQKAAAILIKNPVEKLYLVGEKKIAELQEAVLATVNDRSASSSLHIRLIHYPGAKPTYYGILDYDAEAQLRAWAKDGFSDDPLLPISSRLEFNHVNDTLQKAIETVKLAQKIKWANVLDTRANHFASEFFARKRMSEASLTGGVLKPFLISLLVNAMSEGWDKTAQAQCFAIGEAIQRFVIVNTVPLRHFLEFLMFDFEQLPARAEMAKERILKITRTEESTSWGIRRWTHANHPFMSKGYTNDDLIALMDLAGQMFEQFMKDANAFYMRVKSIEAPTSEEIDRFWRGKMFLYAEGIDPAMRLSEEEAIVKKPWNDVSGAKTIGQLVSLLPGFRVWPEEEKARFVQEFNLAKYKSPIETLDDRGKKLIEMYDILIEADPEMSYVPLLIEALAKNENIPEIIAAISAGELHEHHGFLRLLIQKTKWSRQQAMKAYNHAFGKKLFGYILDNLDRKLSDDEWCEIATITRLCSYDQTSAIWRNTTENQHRQLILCLWARRASDVMRKMSFSEIKNFFKPIVQEAQTSRLATRRFVNWFFDIKNLGIPNGFNLPRENQIKLINWLAEEFPDEGIFRSRPV